MTFNKFELEERATSGLALCITRLIFFFRVLNLALLPW